MNGTGPMGMGPGTGRGMGPCGGGFKRGFAPRGFGRAGRGAGFFGWMRKQWTEKEEKELLEQEEEDLKKELEEIRKEKEELEKKEENND